MDTANEKAAAALRLTFLAKHSLRDNLWAGRLRADVYSSVLYILCLGMIKLVHLVDTQGFRGAELMCYQSYVCKVLECFHLLERFKECLSIADRAVIRHEDGIMSWKEGHKTGCHLVRPSH